MFARTERLLLRPGWMEDAPALVRALDDQAVARNLSRVPSPYTAADAEAFLGREAADLPTFLIFARTQRAPRLVGGIGLHRAGSGEVELGYWIARAYWGLGFATEAGRAVVALADESLRIERLVSGHFRDNPASGRVLRKLGFRPTGAAETRACQARAGEVSCLMFARQAGAAMPELDRAPLAA